ncbi:MAG: YciI family protein [Acidobacteriaceae bacterium]
MKYILMMNTMRAGVGVPAWPKADLQAMVAFMRNLNRDLRDSGELVQAEGLSFPDQARQVRAGKDGVPVTDGIFPESKEFLAGFWIVDVDSPERAYAIAARASAAPGLGGAPLNMPIEVRPVMSAPPSEIL